MMCITQSVSELMQGARRIDRDSGRSEAKLGAEWGSVRENQAFGTCSQFVRKSSRCILKYKKLLGAGQGFRNTESETETSGLVAGVPAFSGTGG